MRVRRYVPAVVISALLAVSGFAAAAIASSNSVAAAAQTGTTTVVTTVASPPSTVTQTVTVTRRFPLVRICHHRATSRGGPAGRHVTIRVSSNQVAAHRSHGDTLGSCSSRANRRIHRSRGHVRKFH